MFGKGAAGHQSKRSLPGYCCGSPTSKEERCLLPSLIRTHRSPRSQTSCYYTIRTGSSTWAVNLFWRDETWMNTQRASCQRSASCKPSCPAGWVGLSLAIKIGLLVASSRFRWCFRRLRLMASRLDRPWYRLIPLVFRLYAISNQIVSTDRQ